MISVYSQPEFAKTKGKHCPIWRYVQMTALEKVAENEPASQLSTRENRECNLYRDSRRIKEFCYGRMVAKQLIAEQLPNVNVSQIEIVSRDLAGRAIRPQASAAGHSLPFSLSIAHTDRGVLAAVCCDKRLEVGVDLTPRGPISRSFARLWFTRAEQAWFDRSGASEIGRLLWTAKEAVFKACNHGEPFDPTTIEILPSGAGAYRGEPLASLQLRSWEIDGQIAVVATVERDIELDKAASMMPDSTFAVDADFHHRARAEKWPTFEE